MRIPITMCHGTTGGEVDRPLTREYLARLMGMAAGMGFESIGYDDLEAWRAGERELPGRPVMFDFDHAVPSIGDEVFAGLDQYGFRGNLFVDTDRVARGEGTMSWEEIGELADAGWGIGAHTVTHPNLSELGKEDPSGEKVRAELQECDEAIHEHLGIWPRDFAYTGTSLSGAAVREVARRYRFGRLWIIGDEYQMDGKTVRFTELVGGEGESEADGGPPMALRYVTEETDPYMLPSVDIQFLLSDEAAFRNYLEGALGDG